MNGISVMSFVQSPYSGVYAQGAGHEKCITISRKTVSSEISGARKAGKSRSTCEQCGPAPSAENTLSVRENSGEGGKEYSGSGCRPARRASVAMFRALVLAFVFSGMLAGFRMMTRASNPEKEQTWKYYTTVTIEYGEDLTDIVYRYCDSAEYASAEDYVREVCSINSLPYRRGEIPVLHAGTQIVIPYFSTEYK